MFEINSQVAAFGKIVYIPTREEVPPLPEMNLLFLKDEDQEENFPWRAVCIDLEIDASGNSKNEAWENLKKTLTLYIEMERKAAGGDVIETAKKIIETAFTPSDQKMDYINLYRKAKLAYTIHAIESGKIPDPIKDEKERIEKLESEQEYIRSVVNELRAA